MKKANFTINTLKLKKTLVFISMCLLFLSVTNLFGQKQDEFVFENISTEIPIFQKGLSQNSVYSIIQDKKGYLWFGTWDGLNRYDGYEFVVYNRSNGLCSQSILSLKCDKDGNIWIGTEEGLNIYHSNTSIISSYLHDPDDSTSLSNNRINNIFIDDKDEVWIATASGLNKFVPEKNHFIRYLSKAGDNTPFRSNNISQVIRQNDSLLWMSTRYGLIKYNLINGIVNRFFYKPDDKNSLSSNLIQSIVIDKNNVIWVGTNLGLNYLEPNQSQFHRVHLSESRNTNVSSLFIDKKNQLWVGTNGFGLISINFETGDHNVFKKNSETKLSLSNDWIQDIYEDKLGDIWVGTFFGASKIEKNTIDFQMYSNQKGNIKSLHNNLVWSLIEHEPGKFLIGTSDGLCEFNELNESFQKIFYTDDDPVNLSGQFIKSLFKDIKGNWWIGTQTNGLFSVNPHNMRVKNYRYSEKNPYSICGNYILSILENTDGSFWIGTSNGLNKMDESGNFVRYFTVKSDSALLGNSSFFNIYRDSKNNTWFSSYQGLLMLSEGSDEFIHYRFDPENSNGIPTNSIFSIIEDHKGILWLTTRGSGLISFNPETKNFISFLEKDGLSNNITYGVLEDNNNNLWISTNWGLSKLIRNTQKFINYNIQDGLQSNEFNVNAQLISSSGKMIFGGMGGFNTFYPEQIIENQNIPPIVITRFNIFNKKYRENLNNKEVIELNYNDNFFSIEFSALDFHEPYKNKYKCKLDNYDQDWNIRDANHRIAEYTNVSPGTYHFFVKGSNNDNYWNEEGVSITIIVHPPFWGSWWFRFIVFILISALIWFALHRRFQVVRRKHDIEKQVLEFQKQVSDLERQALRLQMNPHFIFNSLNSIQSFVIKNDTDTAINYLSKFSQLMRTILTNSREKYVILADEIKAIVYYMDLERLRFDNKFSFDLFVEPEIDEEFVEIPPMILQPYIENAIIHGFVNKEKAGEISIIFSRKGNSIYCNIKDNGIGRSNSYKRGIESGITRQPKGMLITKRRLELLNLQNKEEFRVKVRDLIDDLGNSLGTLVELQFQYREI